MNEAFIPFELAVKLKEKGFDYKCLFVYNKEQIINPEIVKAFGELSDDGYYELTKEGGGRLDWSFVYINEYQLIQYRDVLIPRETIKAPTISQVYKWLRKKHFIHISTKPYPCEDGTLWLYEIRKFSKYLSTVIANKTGFVEEEQASLAGIGYVLDNLKESEWES